MPWIPKNEADAMEFLETRSLSNLVDLFFREKEEEIVYATNAIQVFEETFGHVIARRCRPYLIERYGVNLIEFYGLLRETIDKHVGSNEYSTLKNLYNDILPGPINNTKYEIYGEPYHIYCEKMYMAYNSFTERMNGFTGYDAEKMNIPSEDLIIWIGLVYSFNFEELNILLYKAGYGRIGCNTQGNIRQVFIREAFMGTCEDALKPLENKQGFERALAFNSILYKYSKDYNMKVELINPKKKYH